MARLDALNEGRRYRDKSRRKRRQAREIPVPKPPRTEGIVLAQLQELAKRLQSLRERGEAEKKGIAELEIEEGDVLHRSYDIIDCVIASMDKVEARAPLTGKEADCRGPIDGHRVIDSIAIY